MKPNQHSTNTADMYNCTATRWRSDRLNCMHTNLFATYVRYSNTVCRINKRRHVRCMCKLYTSLTKHYNCTVVSAVLPAVEVAEARCGSGGGFGLTDQRRSGGDGHDRVQIVGVCVCVGVTQPTQPTAATA